MKAIFLFPGQGAQYPGMGLDLIELSPEAKKIFDTASNILNRDIIDLIKNSDPDTLKRTDISQIAISAVSLASAACLKERGIFPAACAGFSLGEYPALYCAGVIGMDDCFRLTGSRGKIMQAAIDHLQAGSGGSKVPGMAAVIGLAPAQVETLIAQWKSDGLTDLYAANINSPKQVVVSGSTAALEEAEKRFKEAGAKRVFRLAVAGPFHSPFMKEAAEVFASALHKVQFNDPFIPLFSNVTGNQIKSGAEAKTLALRQIVEAIRWTDEEAAIAGLEPELMLEVGPGKVLQGLWRDTGSKVPCFSAGTAKEINELQLKQ